VGGEAVIVGLLTDLADRLDELIIGVVAASSGGFIGGWMALRAAKTSLDRAARASREERQAAAIAQRQSALTALVAELRLNAALLASEQTDHSPVAPAWRIPFRDAYVVAGRRD
jgi:predicted dienelactone hydrolase